MEQASKDIQILSLRPVFYPAVGLTEPTAGLVFYPKSAAVHRLYIVLKKLCSALVREVQRVGDHICNLCSCYFQNMAVDVARIQPLKRSHISKNFLIRFIKRFSRSHYPFQLQGTFCAEEVFRAACSKYEYPSVCQRNTRLS